MTCTWVGLSCAPSNFKLHCDVGPKKDFGWDVFVYSQFQVRTRYIQYFSERVGRSTLPFREGDLLPVWNSNSPQSSANWLAPTWVPHLHWLNADVIWLGICFFFRYGPIIGNVLPYVGGATLQGSPGQVFEKKHPHHSLKYLAWYVGSTLLQIIGDFNSSQIKLSSNPIPLFETPRPPKWSQSCGNSY